MMYLLAAISSMPPSLVAVAAAVVIATIQAMVETARQSILPFQRHRMRVSPCGSVAAVESAALRYTVAVELEERRALFLWTALSLLSQQVVEVVD